MGITLRPATIEDAEMILSWRNDEVTRANSFSGDVITYEAHMEWFRKKLADENCYLYIMTDDDECVGQARIDVVNDIGEISYMTAPGKRGKGYGRKIISLCEDAPNGGVRAYMGLVQKENEASRKCFLQNGYAEFNGGDIFCYIKTLNK